MNPVRNNLLEVIKNKGTCFTAACAACPLSRVNSFSDICCWARDPEDRYSFHDIINTNRYATTRYNKAIKYYTQTWGIEDIVEALL